MFFLKKRYFYMITVENTVSFPVSNRVITISGEFSWKGTEYDAYRDRLDHACKTIGLDPNRVITRFWYLSQNRL